MPARNTLGIDLGGTTTTLAVVGARNRLIRERSFPTAETADLDAFVGRVRAEVAAMATPFAAAAAAAAAQVDPATGYVVASPNLPFAGAPLGPSLAAALGVPVRVENDVNAAAWGEYLAAPGGREPLLAVFVGTGIGSGIVAAGCLFRGADGFAGEIGHVPVVREGGEPCGCGKHGCLEAYAGGLGICRRADAASPRPDGISFRHVDDVVAAASAGDVACARVLDEAAAYLGMGLGAAVNLLNPGTLVIGGGVTRAWPPLYDRAVAHLAVHGLPALLARLIMRPSAWGARAGVVGAAALARELLGGPGRPAK
jgi:glucokinase